MQGNGTDSDCSGGIKAFETAMTFVSAAGSRRGFTFDFEPRSICEKDPVMMRMGCKNLPSSTCRFLDAMDIYADPSAYTLINDEPTYESKFALAWSLPRSAVARCMRHMSWCPIVTGASCKMTGLPCQDFSRAGLREGVLGKNMAVLFAAGDSLHQLLM